MNLRTEVTRKQTTSNFPRNKHPYPLMRTHTCAHQGVGNVCFSENLASFVFLWPPFWDLPFCLTTVSCIWKLSTKDKISLFFVNIFQRSRKTCGLSPNRTFGITFLENNFLLLDALASIPREILTRYLTFWDWVALRLLNLPKCCLCRWNFQILDGTSLTGTGNPWKW